MDAWEKFKRTIIKEKLIKVHDRILVGVSGGPDSMTLLHLLWRLKKTLPLELFPVYLDHGLRRQSSAESALVARFSEKLESPAFCESIPVKAFAASHKLSLETAGRELRYGSFIRLAKAHKCNKIATAHTSNDNAETVMMWLIRGTGTDGLEGIPLCRPTKERIRVIRPMLSVTREEVMRYIQRQKLPFATDASNFSMDFTRNKIRQKLIPLLSAFNPRIVEHLFNLSRIIRLENESLKRRARAAIRRSATITANRITLDLKQYFRYNELVQPRILKEVLPENRSMPQIERIHAWISSPGSKKMRFSGSWVAEKRKHTLLFIKRLNDKKG